MLAATPEVLAATAATLVAGVAAVFDVKSRRIPNLLTGCSCLAGLALHLWLGGVGELGLAALSGLVVGAGFLLFYMAGGMGAGDVKLMAAVGCIGAGPLLGPMLLAAVFSGALFALAIALYHRQLGRTVGHALTLIGGLGSGVGSRRLATLKGRTLDARTAEEQPDVSCEDVFREDVFREDLSRERVLNMPFALPVACGCLFALCMQIGKG